MSPIPHPTPVALAREERAFDRSRREGGREVRATGGWAGKGDAGGGRRLRGEGKVQKEGWGIFCRGGRSGSWRGWGRGWWCGVGEWGGGGGMLIRRGWMVRVRRVGEKGRERMGRGEEERRAARQREEEQESEGEGGK